MIRGVEQVSYEDKQRVGVVQPGEGSRETLQHLPVPKEDLQKKGESDSLLVQIVTGQGGEQFWTQRGEI